MELQMQKKLFEQVCYVMCVHEYLINNSYNNIEIFQL